MIKLSVEIGFVEIKPNWFSCKVGVEPKELCIKFKSDPRSFFHVEFSERDWEELLEGIGELEWLN